VTRFGTEGSESLPRRSLGEGGFKPSRHAVAPELFRASATSVINIHHLEDEFIPIADLPRSIDLPPLAQNGAGH
jgi:hypothetical protein